MTRRNYCAVERPTYPMGYVQRYDPYAGAWIWVKKKSKIDKERKQ